MHLGHDPCDNLKGQSDAKNKQVQVTVKSK